MERFTSHHIARWSRRVPSTFSAIILALLASACAAPGAGGERGVLVMAHGGSEAWNEAVLTAVEPLAAELPTEVAFGMATADTLQDAVTRLESRGVRDIAVVRLFVSGESFKDRTEQILGLRPGAPARPDHGAHDHDAGHAGGGHSMEFWRVATESRFRLGQEGLLDCDEIGDVLAARVRALSDDAPRESVLILAHGPADDGETERWLASMDRQVDAVRAVGPFRDVRIETLREDWAEKRAASERRIREFVGRASEGSGRVLVVPYRVHGFGPYAEVLDGLDYTADGRGLLPHVVLQRWLHEQAAKLFERVPPTSS